MLFGEGFGAQGAAEGLDSRVEAMVQGHVAAIGKGLAAHGALIRFLTTVRPHVLFEQHFTRKSLSALVAFVGFHAGMNPDMHIEGHTLIERFGTVRTLVLLPVPVNL